MVKRAPVHLAISSLLLGTACQFETGALDSDASDSSSTKGGDDDLDGSSGTGSSQEVCGDGEVGPTERCDDGINDGSYGGCAPGCASLGPRCGDGHLDPPEQCDGGSECSLECVLPGGMVWLRTSGDAGADEAGLAIAVTSRDDIVVAGHRQIAGEPRRGWIRSFDPDGDFGWDYPIEAPSGSMAEAYGVAVDPSDDAIVAIGRTAEVAAPHRSDLWLLRLHPEGTPDWIQSFGAVESAFGRSVAVDDAGSIYAAGEVDEAAWLRVYDGDGRPGWTETYGMPDTGVVGATSVAAGERVAIAGFVSSATRGLDPWFAVYERDGTPGWSHTTGSVGSIPELAHDIAVSPAGTVAVVGIAGEDVPRVWIGVYQPDGEPKWTAIGPEVTRLHLEREGVRTVAFGSDESLFVAGALERGGKVVLRKYDPEGEPRWDTPIALDGDAVAHGLAIDSRGYVVITGSLDRGDRTEGWFAKFAP